MRMCCQASLVVLAIALGCFREAAAAKVCGRDTPLPSDVALKVPDAAVPESVRRYAGIWRGVWKDNTGAEVLCQTLVVEEVLPNGYARTDLQPWHGRGLGCSLAGLLARHRADRRRRPPRSVAAPGGGHRARLSGGWGRAGGDRQGRPQQLAHARRRARRGDLRQQPPRRVAGPAGRRTARPASRRRAPRPRTSRRRAGPYRLLHARRTVGAGPARAPGHAHRTAGDRCHRAPGMRRPGHPGSRLHARVPRAWRASRAGCPRSWHPSGNSDRFPGPCSVRARRWGYVAGLLPVRGDERDHQ